MAHPKLPTAEILKRIELAIKHGGASQAAEAHGISPQTYSSSMRIARARRHAEPAIDDALKRLEETIEIKAAREAEEHTPPPDVDEPLSETEQKIAHQDMQARRSKRTNVDLQRRCRFLETELLKERERGDLLLGIRENIQSHPIREIPYPKRVSKNPTVTCSMASDWHVEERVEPEKVNYRNEHNLAISEEKVALYFRNVLTLYKKEAAGVDVREHLAWFGGDFFSGHIHDDLIETCELTPLESVRWLLPRIRDGIRLWRAEMDCPNIRVVWNHGNHGRDGKIPKIAMAAEHNYDWLIGTLIEDEFRDEKGITVQVGRAYHNFVRIQCPDADPYVIRFHHGDWTKYMGGVGGLTIPLNRAVNEWNKTIRADLDVIGHWHQFMALPNFIVNGSLIGLSPYAISVKAAYEPAQQAFFMVDMARRQRTGVFPVHVTPWKAKRAA